MNINLTRPLAFIDLETTGVNVVTDRIVEICILKLTPENTKEVFTFRINPTIPIPKESSAIHGIKDEDVKDCPTFAEMSEKLNEILVNCDLAGFNSNKFDIPMLIEEFMRSDVDFDITIRRLIDVQNIFHKMEQRTLSAAYKFYCNKDLINAHSSEADTVATYEVLLKQLEKYENVEISNEKGEMFNPIINNVQALHDFSYNSKNVDLVGHIVYNDKNQEVFNFGKYKGMPVEDVFRKEFSYYDWMIKSNFPLYTKRVITKIKNRMYSQNY